FAIYAKQIEPRILAIQESVAGHHGAECAQRESVPAKTGRDEFTIGVFADERKSVIGLDDLSEPMIANFGHRQHSPQRCIEPLENFARVVFLARLRIITAKNVIIVIVVWIDA